MKTRLFFTPEVTYSTLATANTRRFLLNWIGVLLTGIALLYPFVCACQPLSDSAIRHPKTVWLLQVQPEQHEWRWYAMAR